MYLVSRTAKFARLFFLVCFCGLLAYVVIAFYTFHLALSAVTKQTTLQYKLKKYPIPEAAKSIDLDTIDLKYILLWKTSEFNFTLEKEGEQIFIDNNCAHRNCYLTSNKTLLGNVTQFDAIVFSLTSIRHWKRNFPKQRSEKQKYVLFASTPANDRPICAIQADDFFNWTWTYKLNSDIPVPFIEVRDLKGHFIAPSLAVEWPDNGDDATNSSDPNKRKAVMWHNKDCERDQAKSLAKNLKKHLPEHSMDMDIFGCDDEKCPTEGCEKIIENYYFYLSIDESMSDDYVTTDVLKAYHHDTVPVLVGGANYGRFLPPGSYIDARYDSPERLASLLGYIARNPSTYNKYFTWKKHYTINEANLQKSYCHLCGLLNDKRKVETHSSYGNIRKWWYYGNLHNKCYPKGAERFDEVLSYLNNRGVKKNKVPL